MKTKTKVDLGAFLSGVATLIVARFLLENETREVLLGFSLQGYCYIIGLLGLAYAILPRLFPRIIDALLNKLGLKPPPQRRDGHQDSDVDTVDSDPPPPRPHKPHRYKG